MSAESLEIIRNLAQAAATSYDGALDENGEPMSLGLKREEGHPVHDSRTVDGFKIRFQGPQMIVTYQSDIKLKEIYKGNFENEIESTFADIVKWLKKEYRKVAKQSVSLKPVGEADILVQETSRIRVFVTAHKKYEIGGLKDVIEKEKPSKDRLDTKFKNFLDAGGWGTKPKNKNQKGG